MRTNRRNFLNIAALTGATASLFPLSSCSSPKEIAKYPDYTALDEAMRKPVLKKELFSQPIIIEKLELLQDRNNFICRVRSKDGAEGISIGHPFISKISYSMFSQPMHHHVFSMWLSSLTVIQKSLLAHIIWPNR